MGAAGAVGAKGATGARGARGATGRSSSNASRLPKFQERDLPSWDDKQFKGRLDDLKEVGDRVTSLQKRRSEIDDEIKAQNVLARAIMEDINSSSSWSVRDPAWTCSYVKPEPTKKLVRELLVQAGVTLKQLEKGTKTEPKSPYVSFQAKKEKADKGDSEED